MSRGAWKRCRRFYSGYNLAVERQRLSPIDGNADAFFVVPRKAQRSPGIPQFVRKAVPGDAGEACTFRIDTTGGTNLLTLVTGECAGVHFGIRMILKGETAQTTADESIGGIVDDRAGVQEQGNVPTAYHHTSAHGPSEVVGNRAVLDANRHLHAVGSVSFLVAVDVESPA